jgi:hypothetical protein
MTPDTDIAHLLLRADEDLLAVRFGAWLLEVHVAGGEAVAYWVGRDDRWLEVTVGEA